MGVENRHRRALEIREAVINDVRQYIGAMKEGFWWYYFGGDQAEIEFKTPVRTQRLKLEIFRGEPPQPPQAGRAATGETFVLKSRDWKIKMAAYQGLPIMVKLLQ